MRQASAPTGLTRDGRVCGDRDARRDPRPQARGAVDLERPVDGGEPIDQAAQPAASAGVRVADAVIGDLDQELAKVGSIRTLACSALAYLFTLASASDTT